MFNRWFDLTLEHDELIKFHYIMFNRWFDLTLEHGFTFSTGKQKFK